MRRTLRGFEPLRDEFLPRLVGLHHTRRQRPAWAYPKGAPVVEAVAGRDRGRTVLLDGVFEDYNGRLPLARADLGAPDLGTAGLAPLPEDGLPNASAMTHLLHVLEYKLTQHSDHQLKRLPRLAVGLLVVSAWQPPAGTDGDGPPPDPDAPLRPAALRRAERELWQLLATAGDTDARRRKALLRGWLDALAQGLAADFVPVPGLGAALQATLTTASQELLRDRPDKGVLRWWRDALPQHAGDGVDRLFALALGFRHGGTGRTAAEDALVAALLADIDAAYTLFDRTNRTPRPLLLLDNTHEPLGVRFLGLLDEAYGAGREATRPVVLATPLGDGTDCVPLTDLPDLPTDGAAARLRLALPRVRHADIQWLLGPGGPDGDLPRVIARLSGGRQGSATILAAEARRLHQARQSVPLRELLDAALPRLLEKLVPEPTLRERLVLLSAARGERARRVLWQQRRPDDAAYVVVVREADEWLELSGLKDDRALTALLTQELRRTGTDSTWTTVQLRQRHLYDPHLHDPYTAGHSPDYLFHTLALGHVEPLAHALHRQLAELPAREWLARLNFLCSAPHPRHPAPPQPPAPDCPACPRGGPALPEHHAVHRLLDAVWAHADPLAAAPDAEQRRLIGVDLVELFRVSQDNAFFQASRDWPAALAAGVQAPDLPVQED
ncbi:hypothetical protein SRB5_51030 [Streptomyces sp. RB5]|uniref:Uncharacterized protein n=1 Tax=Streptomyces smaragdinus TaxID=2585196 RepID=A0A7K0CN57_9ACTN|nr:hypothetical protein [Streptomyces smaragdinus]MQY14927.1 hypothetical protein [Streptomyces smaragdinus]